jgi:hypothetical protein
MTGFPIARRSNFSAVSRHVSHWKYTRSWSSTMRTNPPHCGCLKAVAVLNSLISPSISISIISGTMKKPSRHRFCWTVYWDSRNGTLSLTKPCLKNNLAERAGFEPATPFGVHDFQSCALDQLCDLSRDRDYNNRIEGCQKCAYLD